MKKKIYKQKVNIEGQHYWKKVENIDPSDKVVKKVGDKVYVWKKRRPYERNAIRYILDNQDLKKQFAQRSKRAQFKDLNQTSKTVLEAPVISAQRFFDFRRADVKGIDTAKQQEQVINLNQLRKQLEEQIRDDLHKTLGEVKDEVTITENNGTINIKFVMKNIDGSRSGLDELVECLAKDYHLDVEGYEDIGKYRVYKLHIPGQNKKQTITQKEEQLIAKKEDIDLELATRAYANVSWMPERRAELIQKEYQEHINSFQEELMSKVPSERHDELLEALAEYKQKYKQKLEEQLHRQSRIASAAVVGRTKFPTATMKKREEVYERKQQEFREWDEKVRRAIKRKFGLIKGPISSDDPEAIQKLRRKIEQLKQEQEKMKKANKIMRTKKLTKEEKIKELVKIGHEPTEAQEIVEKGENRAYPDYLLSNNNANIRRLKQRIEYLQETRSKPTTIEQIGRVKIEDNAEDNRVRIIFDTKPSEEILSELRSHGFRWSYKRNAWQRMRSETAKYYAKKIAEKYNEKSKEV